MPDRKGKDSIMSDRIRILVAKVGCDIHERGALTMMNVFRDEGMEVIYTGRYQTEAAVANAAVNEDVDIIGVSDLSGNLPGICKKILAELKELGSDIPLYCGGLMTERDKERLLEMGVKGAFGTGSSIEDCVRFVYETTGKGEYKEHKIQEVEVPDDEHHDGHCNTAAKGA